MTAEDGLRYAFTSLRGARNSPLRPTRDVPMGVLSKLAGGPGSAAPSTAVPLFLALRPFMMDGVAARRRRASSTYSVPRRGRR